MVNMGKFTEEANAFFKEVAAALNNADDIDHASRVTAALFNALRDRLAPQESMHIISSLPMILKGMYVDGWKIGQERNTSKTVTEFLDEVREYAAVTAARDFGNDPQARSNVQAVLSVLSKYIPEGEWNDIKAQLPESIAHLFDAASPTSR